jgi:AraC-like DNA-binding protein
MINRNFKPSPFGYKFIESFRENNYTTKSALEELIDNSDDANAENIRVLFLSDGPGSKQFDKIIIADDGDGMSPEVLEGSFKIGFERKNRTNSQNGKFGMGGTAGSLALASKKIVLTKQKNQALTGRYYDLEEVKEHNCWGSSEISITKKHEELFYDYIGSHDEGTLIILEKLDRVSNKNIKKLVNELKKSVGVTYCHKLDTGLLDIFINEAKIEPHDPLRWDNPTTQIKKVFYPLGKEDHPGFYVKVASLYEYDFLPGKMKNSGGRIYRNGRQIQENVFKSESWPSLWDKKQNTRDIYWSLHFTPEYDTMMNLSNSKDFVNPSTNLTDRIASDLNPFAKTLADIRDSRVKSPEEDKEKVLDKSQKVLNKAISETSRKFNTSVELNNSKVLTEGRITVKEHTRAYNKKRDGVSVELKPLSKGGFIYQISRILDDESDFGYCLTLNQDSPYIINNWINADDKTRQAVIILISSLAVTTMKSTDSIDIEDLEEQFNQHLRVHYKLLNL